MRKSIVMQKAAILFTAMLIFLTLTSNVFAAEPVKTNEVNLKKDVAVASQWVANALNQTGYKADYSLQSLKEADRFITEQSGDSGVLSSEQGGYILFALGCYVGDVAIKENGGTWVVDESDPHPEINLTVKLDSGLTIWPVQRVMKAYSDPANNKLHAYGLKLSGK